MLSFVSQAVPKAPAPVSPTSKRQHQLALRWEVTPSKTKMTMENPPWMSRCISYWKTWGIFQHHISFQGCTIDGSEIPPFTSWYGKYPIIDRVWAPSQEVQHFFHQQYGEWSVSPKHSGLYKDTITTNRSGRFHMYCLTAQGAKCQICQSQSCVCCLQGCCVGDAIDKLCRSNGTWRIIPLSKWLITTVSKSPK